jgi:hypothetical protein
VRHSITDILVRLTKRQHPSPSWLTTPRAFGVHRDDDHESQVPNCVPDVYSSGKFNAINSYVHQRLANLASVKHGISAQLGHAFHLSVAHRLRSVPVDRHGALLGCKCLTVNDVGEPCAGEPHARFDTGRWPSERSW